MIIKPKVRGFMCITAHPSGCAASVARQIAWVRAQGPIADGPKRVLVLGASTGGPYALACARFRPQRIAAVGLMSSIGPPDAPAEAADWSAGAAD